MSPLALTPALIAAITMGVTELAKVIITLRATFDRQAELIGMTDDQKEAAFAAADKEFRELHPDNLPKPWERNNK